MDSVATQFLLCTVCDAFNNANDKIINIVCNGNTITKDLTGQIMCDVPMNGNFPWSNCVECTYERKCLAGTDCVGCTCDRKQFHRIIVFF